jgi:hypothetical protein
MPWRWKRGDRLSHLRSTLGAGPLVFVLREGWVLMSVCELLWWGEGEGLLILLLVSLLGGALFGAMHWFTCTRELWKLEAAERLKHGTT